MAKPREEIYFSFAPVTPDQKHAGDVWLESDLLFLTGDAGTGKTHLAFGLALQELRLRPKLQIVVSRPMVTAGEDLGFLPGTLAEKTEPFLSPIRALCRRMMLKPPPDLLRIVPLGFMRGETFNDSIMILDEAQSATYEQLKLFLCRMGLGSRAIVIGDSAQRDRPGVSPLEDVIKRLAGVPGVRHVHLSVESCLRHRIVKEALKRL